MTNSGVPKEKPTISVNGLDATGIVTGRPNE